MKEDCMIAQWRPRDGLCHVFSTCNGGQGSHKQWRTWLKVCGGKASNFTAVGAADEGMGAADELSDTGDVCDAIGVSAENIPNDVTIRDTVTPILEDPAKCANFPARTAGFVAVANNPKFFAEAGLSEMPCLADWAIIHFNDCKVGWPRGPGYKHLLIRRQCKHSCETNSSLSEGYHGSDQSCSRHGIEVSKVLTMGRNGFFANGTVIRPVNALSSRSWNRTGQRQLSTGVTTILSIRDCFPRHRILLVGFDFHADTVEKKEAGYNFHFFKREKRLIEEMIRRDEGNLEVIASTQIPQMLTSRCPVNFSRLRATDHRQALKRREKRREK